MGTAATVHATAKTDHPAHQGMYGILEVFVTIIICTLTALTVICSGVWSNGRTGVEQVWDIADIAVGFIVIPNMIALLALSPKFFKLFREYNLRS